MRSKRRIIGFLAVLLLVLNITGVYADSINDLKGKQKDLDGRIKEKQDEIKEKETISNSVSSEIEELDMKIDKAAKAIEETEENIKKVEENILDIEKELEIAERELKEKHELFNQRIRVMYMNGNVGYLEMLLSSKDVKDFLSRKDMVQSIAEHDKDLIRFMREQKELIEEKKKELESEKEKLVDIKEDYILEKEDLDKASKEKLELMEELEKDIKALESEYDKLNEYAASIKSDIVKLQTVTGPYTGGRMTWPVPGVNRITSRFGYRPHPILKTKKLHTGIDIGASAGTNVVAASAGKVIHSGWLGSYGKTIMIDHGGGIVTLYAHNSSLLVSRGESVSEGASIARVGNTGMSTGPHCHFEVRQNGGYVDPMGWLKGN